MASSRVMATTSTANADLPRQQPTLCSSLSTLLSDLQNQSAQSLLQPSDDLISNIYNPNEAAGGGGGGGAWMAREGSLCMKSIDEVWKEMVSGGGGGGGEEGMTLEDFLTKAGAVSEEDVRGVYDPLSFEDNKIQTNNNDDNNNNNNNNHNNNNNNNNNNNGGQIVIQQGRHKRRAVVEEAPVDKATQQKQRRMMKNRESAARSRERKQAYTIELESLVTQLEQENAGLRREQVEQRKKRFKELMENLIPVVEHRRPARVLRRVNSVEW